MSTPRSVEELRRRFQALSKRARALRSERPDHPDTPEQVEEDEQVARSLWESQARAMNPDEPDRS